MKPQSHECTKCNGGGRVICARCNGKGKEPELVFQRIPINNWNEIHKYRGDLEGKSWIFRGQSDANKPLETSLRRHCELFPDTLKDPKKEESYLLREFQRRFHQYSMDIPKETNSLEWLSIMQHYGAPTRLLDFSYSMLIAAYFALERSYGNCSVWAINGKWAVTKSASLFEGRPEHSIFDGPITEKKACIFNEIFLIDNPKRFACPINPFRLTERLTIQKGVFMCPSDITVTFEENLRSMDGHDRKKNIINFVISLDKDGWKYAMDSLYNQNITRATLFPGLEGFACSLKVSPPKLLI